MTDGKQWLYLSKPLQEWVTEIGKEAKVSDSTVIRAILRLSARDGKKDAIIREINTYPAKYPRRK